MELTLGILNPLGFETFRIQVSLSIKYVGWDLHNMDGLSTLEIKMGFEHKVAGMINLNQHT